MATYRGEVSAPEATGNITVAVSGDVVTGNLKIGSGRNLGVVGFTGSVSRDGSFRAMGSNRRGLGADTVQLSVEVLGQFAADGKSVQGTVQAMWNNQAQPAWQFQAGARTQDVVIGGEAPEAVPERATVLERAKSIWGALPVLAQVGTVAGLGYAGWRLWKER